MHQVMHYPKTSVGANMEFAVITVRPDVTLATVQRFLRRLDTMPDNTDKLFVTGRDNVLLEAAVADYPAERRVGTGQ